MRGNECNYFIHNRKHKSSVLVANCIISNFYFSANNFSYFYKTWSFQFFLYGELNNLNDFLDNINNSLLDIEQFENKKYENEKNAISAIKKCFQ